MAAVHEYLPTDGMEPVARGAPLGEGSTLELPLLLLRGVVLFPGESLPLRLHSLDHIRMVLTLASQQQRSRTPSHLGVINTRRPSSLGPQHHPAILDLCESVGTTAELVEVETADRWSVEEGMAAKARGRHRFRIIPPGQPGHGLTTRQGVLWARVQVLAEDSLPPLTHVFPLPRPVRRWALGHDAFGTTYWPPSVWAQFDPFRLMARAQTVLRSVAAWEGVKGATGLGLVRLAQEGQGQEQGREQDEEAPEQDPVAFAFRLAANMPLDDELRQQLLAADTLVDRLRLLLALLTHSATRRLCCARCRRPLAAKTEVFTLPGAEGTVGAYVNPHGHVHQTLTLRDLVRPERVFLEGEPESQASWFAGFAWQIAYCSRCGLHLGWRFSLQELQEPEGAAAAASTEGEGEGGVARQRSSSSQDRPLYFWGLRRAALVDELDGEDEDGGEEEDDEGGPLDEWLLAAAQDSEIEVDEEGDVVVALSSGSDTASESSESSVEDEQEGMDGSDEEGEEGT